MTHPPAPPQPRITAAAESARQDRQAREAEALRANLRRRKEQARVRAAANASQPEDKP